MSGRWLARGGAALALLLAGAARAAPTTFSVDVGSFPHPSFVQLNNLGQYPAPKPVFNVDLNTGTGSFVFTTFSLPSIDQGLSTTTFTIVGSPTGQFSSSTGSLVFSRISAKAVDGETQSPFDFMLTTESVTVPACDGASVLVSGMRRQSNGAITLVGTAINAAGQPACVDSGAYSNTVFQIELSGTLPLPGGADADGDGVPDASDNCPYVANANQLDNGGIGTSTPDGIGTACQCGDVTNNGIVNGQDGTFIRRHGIGYVDPLFVEGGKCDVTGNGICDGQDGTFTARAGLGYQDPLDVSPRGQHCHTADPAAPPCPTCAPCPSGTCS